jgi:hypothetical protein
MVGMTELGASGLWRSTKPGPLSAGPVSVKHHKCHAAEALELRSSRPSEE